MDKRSKITEMKIELKSTTKFLQSKNEKYRINYKKSKMNITTVLLVNNQGPSTFGRFLSVKPDLGLITSTARTFIQEGVTTQYATQVLGTTLDNGRLYAHLVTKSSRVLYDNDKNTRPSNNVINKKWNVDENLINSQNFIKNIDYISPNKPDAYLVFPTIKPNVYKFVEKDKQVDPEEILKSLPSENPRLSFDGSLDTWTNKNNVKIFQISQKQNDYNQENAINHKEINDRVVSGKQLKEDLLNFEISKVRERDTLPTFTVRNEFSPSGLTYLGDFPSFDTNTEKSKATTAAERKAKLLFLSGRNAQDLKKLPTVTYTGFADFTTVVGDTVIVFSPHTSSVPKYDNGKATSISVEATLQETTSFSTTSQKPQRPSLRTSSVPLIRPTTTQKIFSSITKATVRLPQLSLRPSFTIKRPKLSTKEYTQHTETMHTVVIDATDRQRETTTEEIEQHEDMDAKSAVLANEQKMSVFEQSSTPELEHLLKTSEEPIPLVTPSAIEPSESQIPMLSTPSEEDIAKILASLQAAQSKKATEPLQITTSTLQLIETTSTVEDSSTTIGGATTIFFDDDFILQNTEIFGTTKKEEAPQLTTPETVTVAEEENEDEEIEDEEEEISTTQAQEIVIINNKETTTEKAEATTHNIETTTQPPSNSSNEFKDELRDEIKSDVICTEGVQILPTTVYKTLTYLTTFFIPVDSTSTTTSVKFNEIISTEIGFESRACSESVKPSEVVPVTVKETDSILTTTEQEITNEPTTLELEPTTEHITTHDITSNTSPVETTPMEITTERRHVTESEPETTEMTTDSGEEIEVLFKTLYTTYTYLTTFFQDTTSSVVSRKEIITNVITSTLEPGSEFTDPAVAGLFNNENFGIPYKSKPPSFNDIPDIAPTSVGAGRPTVSYPIADEDIRENILDQDAVKATPSLVDKIVPQPSGIKTYYTTYTYFTTIFVDGETEISSRTEVYTNYVTPVQQFIEPTIFGNILTTTEKEQNDSLYDSDEEDEPSHSNKEEPIQMSPSKNYELNYSTLNRGNDDTTQQENDFETISTMVTDVRSSTSTGESRIIDNTDNRNILDDQMVAESNNDSDILPSPTLLLQTSYTTFTYFTTLYQGTTASNVVSSLDTVTNIVTETLTPTHSLTVEDLNLPITYFTTFTYWTTLYKDGVTRVTSREETISNIVPPTSIANTATSSINITPIEITSSTILDQTNIQPTKSEKDELTTYYTTYTYYTTSYVGDSTVINSRLDTVTNVANDSTQIDANQIARAIGTANQNRYDNDEIKPTQASALPTGLLSTLVSTADNSGTKTLFSTDVYGTYIDGIYAKVLESTTKIITASPTEQVLPTGIVSLNQGKIVDAEGISTLYYTTQAVGTYIDNLYAQVIESTSSIKIDEERKSAVNTDDVIKYKTGLVRLIEGSIIQNHTTTLYESKVIGTVIEGRYAQIIESTSSFIVDKTQPSLILPTLASEITPTATQAPDEKILPTNVLITPSPVAIESSISDSAKGEEEVTEGDDEEDDDDDQETTQEGANGRKKSRLTFQSRKRTFTPVIRPFASRGRPTFAPKRTKLGPSSATTITRSDFTPTVTAVLASKTGGRFGSRKSQISTSGIVLQPSASGSRRFVRPKSSSISVSGFSSSYVSRGKGSLKITPTASGSRKFNAKTSSQLRSSALYTGSNRFARIRPTAVSSLSRASTKSTTPSNEVNEADNDLTTQITENPTELTDETQETTLSVATTTEVSRRSQNPLLKFRKPLARPTQTPKTTIAKPIKLSNNKAGSKLTTTTFKPKTTRPIAALQSRQRPGNSLFPRRGLFTTTTSAPEEEEVEEDDLDGEDIEEDTDYEGSNRNTQTEKAPTTISTARKSKAINVVSLRPFKFRQRSKRETNFSRFRRPPSYRSTTAAVEEVQVQEEAPSTKPSRYSKSRSRGNSVSSTSPKYENKRITPTRASTSQTRSQFTLREKDKSAINNRSNFRRGNVQTQSNRRTTTTTISSRPKVPKLRNQHVTEHTRRKVPETNRATSRTSRRGSTSTYRSRNSGEVPDSFALAKLNVGTITVTHSFPTEITIPVVNGRVTEYRNVITAKYSTEVLIPQQYSTAVNSMGQVFTVLKSDSTNVAGNGATEITRYILNETPTTAIIFTPTYIRGHKTSYSHILPSTVYQVEQVVSTIKPALAAQAPLANILLSQLLLGNPGLQPNPLLGLQNPASPATPTTEFKTRTTTYVTTVTSETSTVIPITFRGKQILTTIIDSSVNVVTATEFITDTVVVTPTIAANGNLNSLLLPLLLQQQQPSQLQPPGAGAIGFPQDQVFPEIDNKYDFLNFEDNKSVSESEEFTDQTLNEDVTRAPRRKNSRKKQKNNKLVAPISPPKESSIVTLYVSGKTPGEFSTVLSTVISKEELQRQKRDVLVQPSGVLRNEESTYSYVDVYISPALAVHNAEDHISSTETQSLESVLGDVITNPLSRNKRIVDNSLPKRRVVKKLVRVEPIHREINISETKPNVINKHSRKRVIVKKRPHVTPTTHRRRTMVITKKRLLHPAFISTPEPQTPIVETSTPLPYEPFFPELSESVSELVFLTTTVVSSIEFDTSTVVQNRLRTYTFVVTRVNGDETVVTSTTDVKPQTKTLTVTVPRTIFTTLTLLDLEDRQTLPFTPVTIDSTPLEFTSYSIIDEEPRYNLATRIMSNGVEVIVAGDKTTLPGEPDIKRILPTTIFKPITLKPSTLSDHMMMHLPQESSKVEILPQSLYSNQFVTKTCLTTFTYLTTYLKNGTSVVSSHEQVVSNIATENRNPQKIASTSSTGITLTQHLNLATETFLTTYTYLNTILDGEQPIVVTSKHTVTNTVTAPDDYLSFFQPLRRATAARDTNTYYSTAFLQKTLYEEDHTQVLSTNEIVTQVVITESIPPKATSVMTSYIALDVEPSSTMKYATTDIVKTYFVTYTYHNPVVENGKTSTKMSVSTSTDIVTEKIFLQPKRSSIGTIINTTPPKEKKKNKIDIQIYATKTYTTTYTSIVTVSKSGSSANTKVIENVITETVDPNQLEPSFVSVLRNDLKRGSSTVTKLATLKNGNKIEIMAHKKKINPSKVLPIEKTTMVEVSTIPTIESSNPNVITGSTIIFFDEPPMDATPSLSNILKTTIKNNLNSLLSDEIIRKTVTKTQTKRHASTIAVTSVYRNKTKTVTSEPIKKKTNTKVSKPSEIPDLLGLGSVNTFQVLKPVINAMAGLIKTNLQSTHKNTTTVETITSNPPSVTDTQSRSPIYIPIGDQMHGLEIAESQNLATIHINEWENSQSLIGKTSHESPLLNGGIPISPGQIITTNSDVIVGRPGRISPRIPSIPLSGYQNDPLININQGRPSNWPKLQNAVVSESKRDEFLSAPPTLKPKIPLRPFNFVRGEKHKMSDTKFNRLPPQDVLSNVQFVTPIREFNLKPSISSQSIVFPEVIERSTGQPVLVNLQPSQVAFVNIPRNRTTALIYGGSTEIHKNGQYFDDPAPYPVPEFSILPQITTQNVHITTVYGRPNQKQVGGFIKVAPDVINNNADVPPIISSQILPSKTINLLPNVNMNVPPLSFEMIHHGNDFNAHIINHGDIVLQPPPPPSLSDNKYVPYENFVTYNASNQHFDHKLLNDIKNPYNVPISHVVKPLGPGPQIDLKEYLTPPKPPQKISYPQKYKPRPLTPNHYYTRPQIPINIHPIKSPNLIPTTVIAEDEEDYHKYDDLANEDGEVVQESNTRPLRPGQVPNEILENYHWNNSHNVNFGHENEVIYRKPIIQHPRPFQIHINKKQPVVKPENQQSNQVEIQDFVDIPVKLATPAFSTTKRTTTNKVIETVQNKRPLITSMPVNTPTSSSKSTIRIRTESPFDKNNNITKHYPLPPLLPLPSDMEIMKPPPPPPRPLLNKVDINTVNVSNIDAKIPPTNRPTILQQESNFTDNVVGLIPPPIDHLVTTQRSKTNVTYKPIFSLEINPPRPIHPYTFYTPSTISTTKKPSVTTVKTVETTKKVTVSSKQLSNMTTETTISTINDTNQTDVFVKNPQTNTTNSTTSHSTSVSIPMNPTTVENLNPTSTAMYSFVTHHAGNEVRIVDDIEETNKSTPPLPTKFTKVSIKENKTIVPTRYITHTKTSTVTITKTTIIKTPGGPSSTMTILVTKTERSTKVDTVTEIHTLVQSSSIVETVTTTIRQSPTNLYPSLTTYPVITSTQILEPSSTIPVITDQDVLEDFIVEETNRSPTKSQHNTTVHIASDNDSIFVVMSDKKKGEVIPLLDKETEVREDAPSNEGSHILLGGILIDSPPSLDTHELGHPDKCNPECKASKNELCQKVHGMMRCVCRPGFARMFPDRPCKPTYTYKIKVILERNGKEKLSFNKSLSNTNSTEFNRLSGITHEGLDRMVMQSDLRDIYHGVQVQNYDKTLADDGLLNNFYLQLSDNTDRPRLEEILKKYLRNNNFSLGGTELYASQKYLENLSAEDFNECVNIKYHDCSEHAHCFNMPGTYTCSCKEGFSDLSENSLYPGRVCSAETIGCERCHYHGTCYSRGDEQVFCECFQWYTGEYCHINLKVLLIALVTLGALLLILLFVCIILTCCRRKPHGVHNTNIAFMPQRLAMPNKQTTLDRRAMINDSSSDGSQSDINTVPYIAKKQKKRNNVSKKEDSNVFPEQKDRSLAVMIPRAKYHPSPPVCVSMVPNDNRKTSAASSNETKLLSYLDGGPNPNNNQHKRKHSNAFSDSYLHSGKISGGALISAGFEVSATVGSGMGTMGTIGTTCGTEADRSENATLIQKISADLLSSTGTRSQFTTFRKSIADNGENPLSDWLDVDQKGTTVVSESRSYDETTIQVPTKSYQNGYDLKTSSQHQNDEANTMAERDVGSTFLLPHTQLYKMDRSPSTSSSSSQCLAVSIEWFVEETRLLLDKYEKYLNFVGPMKKFKNNEVLWLQISDDIQKIFKVARTAEQVENRHKALMKRKKKVTDKNKNTGNVRHSIEYEQEISKIASIDDGIEPEILRGVNVVVEKTVKFSMEHIVINQHHEIFFLMLH
ncbi:hypothetical protein FQA39_LY03642 [Lamprigera yunnana]|nr:hypothetical protein FQA39_LY03642 [Lamprigera yunnana]